MGASTAELDFDFRIEANEYGFYCVPNVYFGRELADILAQGSVYEPNTLKMFRRMVGDGDVVTGGAFIGDFLPAIRPAMAKDTILYTFEPVPMSFAAATETIRLNNLTGIELHPVGVGSEPGTATMLVKRPGGGAISAGNRIIDKTEDVAPERTIEIDITTIDAIVPKDRRVSLVHLDVEGFEKQALVGAKRVLNDSKPMVVCEGDKGWQIRSYLQILNDLVPGANYRHMGTIEHNALYRPDPI